MNLPRSNFYWKEAKGFAELSDAAIADRLEQMCSASNPMLVGHRLGDIRVSHNGRDFTAKHADTEAGGITPGVAFLKLIDKLSTSHPGPSAGLG
jgi:hypothetical protein